jgi:hypothetical protein
MSSDGKENPMSEVGYTGFPADLVSRLEALKQRAESGSVNNADSAMAIKFASLLFDHYAGWARNYLIGRVVRRLPDIQYAEGTPRERALPEDRPWDSPDLMNVGADYNFENSDTNQRLVRDLASDLENVLGPGLSSTLRDAFDDLIFGQQNPLVVPAKVRLKGSAKKLWKLRFEAVNIHTLIKATDVSCWQSVQFR